MKIRKRMEIPKVVQPVGILAQPVLFQMKTNRLVANAVQPVQQPFQLVQPCRTTGPLLMLHATGKNNTYQLVRPRCPTGTTRLPTGLTVYATGLSESKKMAKKIMEIPNVVQPVGYTDQPVQESTEFNRCASNADQPVLI